MRPASHIIASFSLAAALWFFTRSLYAGMICFISGILVDIDHVAEYIIHHGIKGVTFYKVCLACEQTTRREGEYKFEKLYLFFHAGEIVILLWILALCTKNIYILAITLGYTLHMILDSVGNTVYPYFYFITLRAMKGFRAEHFFRKTN